MDARTRTDPESLRLAEDDRREKNWKRWGPYLSERQWGTVREDYSAGGTFWEYFPHDHARSRAYRWGEDGLLGISDRECRLCFALALWNGRDPILKERLFGLTGPQGNHGEDVKECYFYLDATPTHSYLRALYRYPQSAYPYEQLLDENRRRGRKDPEFELLDTGVLDGGRWFDVVVEYAKASPDRILVRITVENHGPEEATLHLLPTVWFRNTWSWGRTGEGYGAKPRLERGEDGAVHLAHPTLGEWRLDVERPPSSDSPPTLLFTENETNAKRLFGVGNSSPYVKDAFHEFVVGGRVGAVNPSGQGTKAAAHVILRVPAGGATTVRLALASKEDAPRPEAFGAAFEGVFETRIQEADAFFATQMPPRATDEERNVTRQAYAGLLWSKQFYHYIVKDWLEGDPAQPPPPPSRRSVRNTTWLQLYNRDVISMPDTWEYPWYAAWDLAFHMIPFSRIDPAFAKSQLVLFLREWYMNPNGQLPAYEIALSDVNPPVHAWACWRVYKMTAPRGERDRLFLERMFQKLLINFTWWVNREDLEGNQLFAGGFLGLDNIGVFDRSKPLPGGGQLEQADGTAWMAFYCTTMLSMALELASEDPAYEDVASKFLEHFVGIADATNHLGGSGLWDAEDGFYYDQIHRADGSHTPLKVRSCVGIVPILACGILEDRTLERLPGFRKRLSWFLENRQDLGSQISYATAPPDPKRHRAQSSHRLLAIPSRERLERVLRYVFDEREFLSPFGIRSLSRIHAERPFVMRVDGQEYRVDYEPGESASPLFGGNSNWRGPVWFPINYLLVEALERYDHFYGDTLRMEFPTGSGNQMDLGEIARELSARLARPFLPDASGRRPCHGDDARYAKDPAWKDLVLFYEYFHGETGKGLGASHQTGWTALVVDSLAEMARERGAR